MFAFPDSSKKTSLHFPLMGCYKKKKKKTEAVTCGIEHTARKAENLPETQNAPFRVSPKTCHIVGHVMS